MGLDDFFEQGHKRHNYGHDDHNHGYDNHSYNQDYKRRDEHHSSHSYNQHNDIPKQLLAKLQGNPNLKKLVIVAVVGILVIVLLLVILLFPVLMKLLGFVTENGILGTVETILKGTK
jgi:ABC-type nickel/cobalt efflux system permease component RcnA